MSNFTVVLKQDEPGFFVDVPALPGCNTQGRNEEDAVVQAKDAIVAWCDHATELGVKIPTNVQVNLANYNGNVSLHVVSVDV
ncbi:type II toxin-antitoxin system HicB family antitoxin [Candidatus Falkowbacteria bacterium]|jgi:predicted RNase H-like HicB family nuclease|nr:type II toxin-antitoxin system HicB family antitoxin [Candidatus Falkowbacteria bacterium]MBT5502717.1 type II toxin-antitoxin system HicB family antitoxin [Candidatus Falkowbacteria bacterium]MBT6573499.1 type II toxin-antitoxin system HicB family antitoxin [Candidatus Falkowbacteria bacterium]MBT7348049.1 type II toxin-antitoxin system HicB family antitoxin [Candidatus Falkowbacteria bacterium]MBT7501116.1 type II toxin-antitoxin system HicB family antitoxin [Candidatus Falkowbacteria bact